MALIKSKSKKGIVMTLFTLILLTLMLAELLTYVIIDISYNQIYQSAATSSTAKGYATQLVAGSISFAKESLSRALYVLALFEYNTSMRNGDLITNSSQYIASLMRDGTIPNAPMSATLWSSDAMQNLTLASYNASIAKSLGLSPSDVQVTETMPSIAQFSPYTITASYVENIRINASGAIYDIPIYVNATIPLNGTYNLFYAEQGVLSKITFANVWNLTDVVGDAVASSAGTGYVYGTVYEVPSDLTCTALSSAVPASLQSPPFNSLLIIATANAIELGSCLNKYGGLITYAAPASLKMPYLVYSNSTGILAQFPTGTKTLIWTQTKEALNIEPLRDAIENGYYFTSPYAPSYLSWASNSFDTQSQYGIFTFATFNSPVANRDSIFLIYNGIMPLPGIGSCFSNLNCSGQILYIGSNPLEPSTSVPAGYLNESQVLGFK